MPALDWLNGTMLFLAAFAAGGLNSVAGGGSFFTFPLLLLAGLKPVNANATSTFALWPGTIASAGAYRNELTLRNLRQILPLFFSTLLGSVLGAILLLRTPQATFMRLVPWLLLGATLLFIGGGRITAWVRATTARHRHASRAAVLAVIPLQLGLAVYIGYFGAGAGIVMLALFAIMGFDNIHLMNGYKTVLASVANGVAVVTFVLAGVIVWPHAIVMTLGAAIGGYWGAWYAQKLESQHIRSFVIFVGLSMSAYFFWLTWF